LARFDASKPKLALRLHYRFIAVDEAIQAADLLPPHSQAFAAVLCQATGWMMSTAQIDGDEDVAQVRFHQLYCRYLKEGATFPGTGTSVRFVPSLTSSAPRDCRESSLSATHVISSGSIDGRSGSAPPACC
jgi:hypothetical protein